MKKGILYLALIAVLFSCKSTDVTNSKSEIVGVWQLVENYDDPGDGSGDFRAVVSDKIIEFHADGSVNSNGTLCFMSTGSETPTSGTYSNTDFTINSLECKTISPKNITFSLKNANLIISYPCPEDCLSKYKKIR